MADIEIRESTGTWSIRVGGAVIGETSNALELTEGTSEPVLYIPRNDLAMAFLERTASTTTCPVKGDATYYAVVTKSETIADAAWSYETPNADVARIAGHIAFRSPKVTIEDV